MKLTKRFMVLGGAAVLATSLALAWFEANHEHSFIRRAAQDYNATLARALSNLIWPVHREFLMGAGNLPRSTLRTHPDTRALDQIMRKITHGLPIVKVKIYDLAGVTVYSSELAQIGEDKGTNEGFLKARSGRIASTVRFKDQFNAFDGVITSRDVLETYVAIEGRDGAVEGVMEVYHDLTGALGHVKAVFAEQFILMLACFGLLFGVLTWVVWRNEQALLRSDRESVALALAAAKAEEASRMKSDFLASMSHELRSPLNAILGFSEAIQQDLLGPVESKRVREYMADIATSGRYLLGILDDILEMSKIDAEAIALEEDLCDVAALVERTLRLVRPISEQAEVGLAVELPGAPILFFGDQRRLQQVLVNLITNAIKFTPAGGEVAVLTSQTAEGALEIAVTDTGPGIRPQHIEHILKPFCQVGDVYARQHGGTGLGLPISKALVELHGGELIIESALEIGTTVRVLLPAWRSRPSVAGDGTDRSEPIEAVA